MAPFSGRRRRHLLPVPFFFWTRLRLWAPSMPAQATLSTWPLQWNLFLLLRRRDGLRDIPPTCSDSSPELIPAVVGLHSAWMRQKRLFLRICQCCHAITCLQLVWRRKVQSRHGGRQARCCTSAPCPLAAMPCTLFCLPHSISPTKAWGHRCTQCRRGISHDVTSDCHCRAANDALLRCITA